MTALSPLSHSRIADVLGRYGQPATLFVTNLADRQFPWQPDLTSRQTKVVIKMLITSQQLTNSEATPDNTTLTQALALLPATARRPSLGDRVKTANGRWIIKQVLPVSVGKGPKNGHQLVQMVLNSAGEA